MSKKFRAWLNGETDVFDNLELTRDGASPVSREKYKEEIKKRESETEKRGTTRKVERMTEKGFYVLYRSVAIISCILLIGVLLFTTARLPRYGQENPEATEVTTRYVESGLQETGAVNIVSGIILDYRAFDTLGESHVLFTALVCVIILMQRDAKNMRPGYEDYYKIKKDPFHTLYSDSIMRTVGGVLIPCILIFGIYVLLNGQNGPGGGFSGGAVIGAGMIIFAKSFGFSSVDRFFTKRLFQLTAFFALSFYSFAKGYVFFMGANGLENHIPKGIPGAILSGGLILPLDIAVGLVVACTMFGFYSLFQRGSIGSD